MDSALEALKSELERFGEENDRATAERSRRMLNITRDTGEFLSVLVRAMAARRVLEIGTSFDVVFLDSERSEYPGWWVHVRRILRPGGLLVVDNATSHREQMAPFVALVKADPGFVTSLVPVGNGGFLAVKAL